MFDATNEERRSRGPSPVTMAEIERVERLAVGRCDYSEKFALYCAEIALDAKGR